MMACSITLVTLLVFFFYQQKSQFGTEGGADVLQVVEHAIHTTKKGSRTWKQIGRKENGWIMTLGAAEMKAGRGLK